MSTSAAVPRTDRPWGHFEILREGPGFQVKLIVVRPGHRMSLQRHRHRDEHWVVARGRADVELDQRAWQLDVGESLDVPRLAWHRLGNSGTEDLVLLELQTGEYFGEDDIERGADDYGRAG